MERSELEKYLDSIHFGVINKEYVRKEYKPSIVEVNGKSVYLFNKGFDITNTPIEENVSISQQPYDSEIPLHMHDYIELMYVYRGTCTVTVYEHTIRLSKGDLIFLNKETPHKVDAITKQDIVINIILKQDYLSPGFLSRMSKKSIISQFMIESLVSHRKENHFLLFQSREQTKVREILENIMCEFFNRDFCSNEIIDSYFIVLFSSLIRHNHLQRIHEVKSDDKHVPILDFLTYIENHFRDCSLVEMGKTFGFNPSYLSTLLKKGTGKSFKELLQLQRLNQAAMLLSDSSLPIPAIADQVGYSSVTFFYKKFKELFHETPYSYKEKHKPKS